MKTLQSIRLTSVEMGLCLGKALLTGFSDDYVKDGSNIMIQNVGWKKHHKLMTAKH